MPWPRASSADRHSSAFQSLADWSPFAFDVERAGGAGRPTIETCLRTPIMLNRLTSDTELSYRRSWPCIRGNRSGIRLICFALEGAIHVSRGRGSCVIEPGQGAIVNADSPFHLRMACSLEGGHESLMMAVPAHLFLSDLEGSDQLGTTLALGSAEGRLIQQLLDVLASGAAGIVEAIEPLVISFLAAIASSIRVRHPDLRRPRRLLDRRLSDIESHVLMNLADPDLSCEKVAQNCGISTRYLSSVLRANGTSFSKLLWSNRLPKARDLLVAGGTLHYPIHEIAYLSGFKSAAHFSRVFKAAYGASPRVYRARTGHA